MEEAWFAGFGILVLFLSMAVQTMGSGGFCGLLAKLQILRLRLSMTLSFGALIFVFVGYGLATLGIFIPYFKDSNFGVNFRHIGCGIPEGMYSG